MKLIVFGTHTLHTFKIAVRTACSFPTIHSSFLMLWPVNTSSHRTNTHHALYISPVPSPILCFAPILQLLLLHHSKRVCCWSFLMLHNNIIFFMDCIINGSPLIEYFKSNGLPEKVYIYIYDETAKDVFCSCEGDRRSVNCIWWLWLYQFLTMLRWLNIYRRL